MNVFRCSVSLAAPLDTVFRFFFDAKSLEILTPPWPPFRVLTEGEIPMARGAHVDCRPCPRGWLLRWRSAITAWEPPHRFVDEQVVGPYRSGAREHRFEVRDRPGRGPVALASDEVHYEAAGGALVNRFPVARDL